VDGSRQVLRGAAGHHPSGGERVEHCVHQHIFIQVVLLVPGRGFGKGAERLPTLTKLPSSDE